MLPFTLPSIASKPKETVCADIVIIFDHKSRGSASHYYKANYKGFPELTIRVSDHCAKKARYLHTLFSYNPGDVSIEEIKEHAYTIWREQYFADNF